MEKTEREKNAGAEGHQDYRDQMYSSSRAGLTLPIERRTTDTTSRNRGKPMLGAVRSTVALLRYRCAIA